KISISELCKLAKVNRGTFYLHYEDIASLFEEYFHEITEDLREAYYEPYVLTGNKIENLNAEMVQIFHHVEKYKQFYKIVFDRNTPLMYYYRLLDIIKSYVTDSILEKGLPHEEFMATYSANAIIGMIMLWVEKDFEPSSSELNQMVIEVMKMKID